MDRMDFHGRSFMSMFCPFSVHERPSNALEVRAPRAHSLSSLNKSSRDSALLNAHRQLASIMRARDTGKPVAVETVSVVRISLKGKTQDQIHAEIRTAAQTVCKAQRPNFSVVSYSSCVADTVRAAKAQLQARNGAAA